MAWLTALLRWVGILIYRLGLYPLVYRWRANEPRVVVYHACAPEEDDFIRGLQSNTTPDALAQHLAFYRKHYQIVDLNALGHGGRTLTITFDDGYRTVYTHALPLLKQYGTPATVYLVTDVVGNRTLVWVNELNWYLHRNGSAAVRTVTQHFGTPRGNRPLDVVIHVQNHYDRARIGRVLEDLRESTSSRVEDLAAGSRIYLDWNEIDIMRTEGITFGNHTQSHANLKRLTAEEQEREIAGARELLLRRIDDVKSLAYPFGYHTAETRRIAAESGHQTVVEIGGTNRAFDPLRIARVPVKGRTHAQLFAEIEVVEPIKALLKRLRPR